MAGEIHLVRTKGLDSLDELAYIPGYPVFHAGEVRMPKGMPGQRKVGFTFPAELVERLDEAKWELRKTKAEIVTEAVEEYLDRHGIKKVNAPPRERPPQQHLIRLERSPRLLGGIKSGCMWMRRWRAQR